MLNRVIIWLVNRGFEHLLIPLLAWTTRKAGEDAWLFWDAITRVLARIIGQGTRFIRGRNQPPLTAMMSLIDSADEMIGAVGHWEQIGNSKAIKTITYCPYAGSLAEIPKFCTHLGVTMGAVALEPYFPEGEIIYEIPQTLSQGNSSCRYILELNSVSQDED